MPDAPHTLLICEQDVSLRVTLVEVLAREGFLVSSAESLTSAFRAGIGGGPNIVLVDIDDGSIHELETLNRLAELRPDVQIILFGDGGESRQLTACLERATRLEKPFSLAELRYSLRKAELLLASIALA